ncbi:NAD-dependent epimerase/dehydratase family protein [Iamia majanohamensis]|uniref:NAD-dependent epimerase/dehydratase family protein n=1 Tax=Iamia majanohamensis TaxID=467976 RepID=A0AAE9Y3N0_9ACTN|nr:NAD(P)H-binding protein [Iamia majanohamensis]WCO65442.1 NAD-dependent epimerase/dehydratase family protein [Iamia majanohamensis]
MRILLTGATGAVGAELAPALVAAGHEVVAATRRPSAYAGPGSAVTFDLDGGDGALAAAVEGVDAAYYLVHGLDRRDVAAVDRTRAARFARAWGPERPVVYLGGLGPDDTGSPHLRSRHEVGAVLRDRCAAVELRASIVIGPRSLSFQLLKVLSCIAGTSPLPVAVPASSAALTQPIAQRDLTAALVAALDLAPGVYDVGGEEVLSFRALLERAAAAQGRTLRTAPVVPLGADWFGPLASVLAGVDPWATTSLFASMATETVVDDARRPPGPDGRATDLDTALALALAG